MAQVIVLVSQQEIRQKGLLLIAISASCSYGQESPLWNDNPNHNRKNDRFLGLKCAAVELLQSR